MTWLAGSTTIRRFGSTPTLCVRTLRVLEQRHVDDAALDGGHRLELDDLAGLDDALRRAVRDVAQLLLAAAAVVLDVDRDAVMLALAAADDQVDDVLQAGELLAAAADQGPEIVALDVQPRRIPAAARPRPWHPAP